MNNDLLEQYYKAQFYRDDLTPFLRMFAERKAWNVDRGKDDPVAKQKRLDEELGTVLEEVRDIYQRQRQKLGTPGTPLTPDEREYGLLHPVVIAEALLAKHDFSDDEKKGLAEILHKSFPRDQVTGYYSKKCMPAMVGFAHLFTKQNPDVPVCIVEGDFSNMGGCNAHFGGKQKTDKLLHEMSALAESSFKGSGALEVECVRQGGDELRLVVYGLKKEVAQKVLDTKVHPLLNVLAAEYGVHDIPHLKMGKLPGFGVAFACAQLNEDTTPGALHDRIEKDIPKQKELDGFLRYGVINEDGLNRYMENIYRPEREIALRKQLVEKGARSEETIHAAIATSLAQEIPQKKSDLIPRMRAARIYWENLIGEGGAYHEDYAKSGQKSPEAFFNYMHEAHGRNPDDVVIPPRPAIDQKIPFYDLEVIKRDEDPEITRMRKALKRFGFDKLADMNYDIFMWNQKTQQYDRDVINRLGQKDRPRLQHMVVDLMHFFDAHDPASLCKTDDLMIEDAKDFVKQHNGMKVMAVEMGNLGGLNNITYDLGNSALREVSRQMRMALNSNPGPGGRSSHTSDHMYHSGGGKFWVLVPPQYRDEDFEGVAAFMHKRIDGAFGMANVPVMKFAHATYASPNPAHFEKEESFEGKGKRKLRVGAGGEAADETMVLVDEKAIRKKISDARLAELEKRLAGVQQKTGKALEQIRMIDIPSLKENGHVVGMSQYEDKDIILAPENVQQRLQQIDEVASKHFEAAHHLRSQAGGRA